MKLKKETKEFLENNYGMICSLMCDDDRKKFRNTNPVQTILDEINKQIKEDKK